MTKATTAMFEAILADDPDALSKALLAGASVNSKYEEETPALCLAMDSSRALDLVILLLAHKAPPNRADEMGYTPLERAIERCDPEIVRRLLEAGANPNALSSDDGPLLHLALEARQNGSQMALWLLRHKAKPNALDDNDTHPLEIAIERRDLTLLSALLEAGANPNAMDSTDSAPMLHHAMEASENAWEMTRLLLERKANPNAKDENDRPALQIAIEARDERALRALLDAGADPNAFDDMGDTPMLILALEARAERPELAQALLAAGANASALDSSDQSSLQIAIEAEDLALASALLSAGADPNATVDTGSDSMLRLALDATRHKRELVQALLAHGANPNELDDLEQSPLEVAIGQADFVLVGDLLGSGADPNIDTSDGASLLTQAMSSHDKAAEMAEALLNHGANPNEADDQDRPPLQLAIEANDARMVKALLRSGADANARDDFDSRFMLHLALGAESAKMEMASALLIHGADASQDDDEGVCPLQMAIDQEDCELAMALLRHGANPNARDEDGSPLLLRAIDMGSKAERMTELLLRYGAEPAQAFDDEGRGPLEAAIERSDAQIALALLKQGADPKGRCADGDSLAALAMERDESDIVELLARYASGRALPSPTRAPRAGREGAAGSSEEDALFERAFNESEPLEPAPEPPAAIPANVKRRSILG